MLRWTRIALPLAALVLGACSAPPEQVSSGSSATDGSSTSDSSPPPTTSTTTTTTSTTGTTVGSGMDTTIEDTTIEDTTAGPTTSDDTTKGTTMGVEPTTSGSSSGESPECARPSDCGSNETCDGMGQCVDVCGGTWGMGSYDYCLDQYGQFAAGILCGAGASHLCVWGATPIEVATCSAQGCADACNCPPPPGTGSAVVSCGPITADLLDDCYLSCGNGRTCPDGMVCRASAADSYCTWPVEPLAMYGDCGGVDAPCASGTCATAVNGMSTWTVCVDDCPGGAGDCDPAPAGAMGEGCSDVIDPPVGTECHLECNVIGDCPAGMVCISIGGGGNLCMWP